MDPRTALVAIWIWHAFFVGLLSYAIGRAAYRQCGRPRPPRWSGRHSGRLPLNWPLQGRWILTAMLVQFTVIFADVARRAYEAGDAAHQIGWTTVAIRAAPCFIEPWAFSRQWRRGLTNDHDD